jgi:hypothetical protein
MQIQKVQPRPTSEYLPSAGTFLTFDEIPEGLNSGALEGALLASTTQI